MGIPQLRAALICVFVFSLLAIVPAPAHAERPVETQLADSAGMACSNVERLAGIIQSEAGAQPVEAQSLIAAIVAREARGRGMDVCALSENTWFVSVWRYAQAHPDSWHAQQFAQPQPWAIVLAKAALADQAGSVAGLTVHHFDGDWGRGGCEQLIGQVCFRP